MLANFVIGQAKLAILKSHQEKNIGRDICIVALFKSLVEARVDIGYTYYKHIDNVLFFKWRWGVKEALVTINEYGGLVFNW